MSRQLEQKTEDRDLRRALAIARALDGGLHLAVGYSGGELRGFSARLGYHDCLLTIRAAFPAGEMVAFVGSESLGGALLKAVKAGGSDGLVWKADKFKVQTPGQKGLDGLE